MIIYLERGHTEDFFFVIRITKSSLKILLNNFYCIVLPFYNSEIYLCGLELFGNLVYDSLHTLHHLKANIFVHLSMDFQFNVITHKKI